MREIIKWFGGRKSFGFLLLLILSTIAVFASKSFTGDNWCDFNFKTFLVFSGGNVLEHFSGIFKKGGE